MQFILYKMEKISKMEETKENQNIKTTHNGPVYSDLMKEWMRDTNQSKWKMINKKSVINYKIDDNLDYFKMEETDNFVSFGNIKYKPNETLE